MQRRVFFSYLRSLTNDHARAKVEPSCAGNSVSDILAQRRPLLLIGSEFLLASAPIVPDTAYHDHIYVYNIRRALAAILSGGNASTEAGVILRRVKKVLLPSFKIDLVFMTTGRRYRY
jgi:hypothetical protein